MKAKRRFSGKQRAALHDILVFTEQLRALLPITEVHREGELFACIEILNDHCNRFLAGEDLSSDRKAVAFIRAAGALKRHLRVRAERGFGYE